MYLVRRRPGRNADQVVEASSAQLHPALMGEPWGSSAVASAQRLIPARSVCTIARSRWSRPCRDGAIPFRRRRLRAKLYRQYGRRSRLRFARQRQPKMRRSRRSCRHGAASTFERAGTRPVVGHDHAGWQRHAAQRGTPAIDAVVAPARRRAPSAFSRRPKSCGRHGRSARPSTACDPRSTRSCVCSTSRGTATERSPRSWALPSVR